MDFTGEVPRTIEFCNNENGQTQMNQSNFQPVAIGMIRSCKARKFAFKTGDLSGQTLTGGQVLMRALILRRMLSRELPKEQNEKVGILIPPSVGGLLVNLACTLDQRIPVNLNYTLSEEVLNHCIGDAGIKKVFTSRKVIEKLPFQPDAEMIFLEDWIEKKVKWQDKLAGVFESYLLPSISLVKKLKLGQIQPDDLQTIIFTSGTTGLPKGVMLSQNNIASNVDAINSLLRLERSDTVAGILPFFHSYGYTLTMWAPMVLDLAAAYHFTPLAGRQVGRLVKKFQATVMPVTPTFLRNYLRRVPDSDFATLRVAVSGAERLAEELKEGVREKFGTTVVEGYGTTELSPIVSGNIPRELSGDLDSIGDRPHSVGRPAPGVAAKVIHPVSRETLPTGKAGLLCIRGPNVMIGYLNQPEKTRKCIVDGWYDTGDIATLDDEGFIFIQGRQKRFSKIGGEMVPQVLIEEKLLEIMNVDGQPVSDEQVAVTSVEDEKKGEALVVLHTAIDQTAAELITGLQTCGLPALFIPQEANFFEVESIPILGTGKFDLGKISTLAEELVNKRNVMS